MKSIPLRLRFRLLLVPVIFVLIGIYPSHAQAGLWGDIKNGYHTITELPDEVNELKENYQATMIKLEETQMMAETLRKQNEQLIAENSLQSKQLSEAMNSIQQADKQKANRTRKIGITLYTGGTLILGYFCSIRILRLILRRKSLENRI
jgi:FtsZ-binding cell division protein ZapB